MKIFFSLIPACFAVFGSTWCAAQSPLAQIKSARYECAGMKLQTVDLAHPHAGGGYGTIQSYFDTTIVHGSRVDIYANWSYEGRSPLTKGTSSESTSLSFDLGSQTITNYSLSWSDSYRTYAYVGPRGQWDNFYDRQVSFSGVMPYIFQHDSSGDYLIVHLEGAALHNDLNSASYYDRQILWVGPSSSRNDTIITSENGAPNFTDSASFTLRINLKPGSGLKPKVTNHASLRAFPNPAKETFTVETALSSGQLMIADQLGRETPVGILDSTTKIDCTLWPVGTYFIRDDKGLTSKVCIVR